MAISANTLFHFASRYDTLIQILQSKFFPRLCLEKGYWHPGETQIRKAKDVYKPEYIIPQLILEWIIDNRVSNRNGLAGVYYTSANRNDDFYILDHEWDNLAIPVQNSLSEEDFCATLKRMFFAPSLLAMNTNLYRVRSILAHIGEQLILKEMIH